VAQNLISLAIRNTFLQLFPDPGKLKKRKDNSEYASIVNWFSGDVLDLPDNTSDKKYNSALAAVDGLRELVTRYQPEAVGTEKYVLMEFVLHGLAEHSLISKNKLTQGIRFNDLFSSLLSQDADSEREDIL
jgi:magnesium chelatase subunit I